MARDMMKAIVQNRYGSPDVLRVETSTTATRRGGIRLTAGAGPLEACRLGEGVDAGPRPIGGPVVLDGELDGERSALARRARDRDGAAAHVDAVGESGQAGTAFGVGAPDPVVADLELEHVAVDDGPDVRAAGAGMLDDV